MFAATALMPASPSQVIDLGVIFHPGSYLRDFWNILDSVVVICAAVSFCFDMMWVDVHLLLFVYLLSVVFRHHSQCSSVEVCLRFHHLWASWLGNAEWVCVCLCEGGVDVCMYMWMLYTHVCMWVCVCAYILLLLKIIPIIFIIPILSYTVYLAYGMHSFASHTSGDSFQGRLHLCIMLHMKYAHMDMVGKRVVNRVITFINYMIKWRSLIPYRNTISLLTTGRQQISWHVDLACCCASEGRQVSVLCCAWLTVVGTHAECLSSFRELSCLSEVWHCM